MRIYSLERKQDIAMNISNTYNLFSNPKNLPLITPPSLKLNMTSEILERMYTCMIITYTVALLLNLPITLVTEITHVDELWFGTYKFWPYQHKFKDIEGGFEATDLIHYALPVVHSAA